MQLRSDAPIWKPWKKLGLTLNSTIIRSNFIEIYAGTTDETKREELFQEYMDRLIIRVMKAIWEHLSDDEESGHAFRALLSETMKYNMDTDVNFADLTNPAAAILHLNQDMLEVAALRCGSIEQIRDAKMEAAQRLISKYIRSKLEIKFNLI